MVDSGTRWRAGVRIGYDPGGRIHVSSPTAPCIRRATAVGPAKREEPS